MLFFALDVEIEILQQNFGGQRLIVRLDILEIKNLTSGFHLHKKVDSEVLQYDQQSVVIATTEIGCSKGQLISLAGRVYIEHECLDFSAVGKVAHISAVLGSCQLTLHLHQFDRMIWKRYVKAQGARQERVDITFGAVKGNE